MAWLIERDEGFTPARAAEFAQWRSANPLHAAAIERLEKAWGLLQGLSTARGEDLSAAPPVRHRRRLGSPAVLWWSLAAAAAVVLGFGWWHDARQNPHAEYSTVAGPLRRIALPDGSLVTLNTHSVVRVRYEPRERVIQLVEGEAHFEVAHDEARPFFVSAGGITVRAVGTAFNVRVATASIEVVVASGKVRLSDGPVTETAFPEVPLLEKGDRLIVPRAGGEAAPSVARLIPAQLHEALAWQEEMLVFADTPLREVIAQFNRCNRVQLRLVDAELGSRLIGGTFASSNVEAFVSLLELGGDLSTERASDREILLRKAR